MMNEVNDVRIDENHGVSCHCGTVVLELYLPNGIVNPRRCNCSLCRRRGVIVASVALANLKILGGAEKLQLSRCNTPGAKHYFCSVCGIHTHHQRQSNPDEYAYNVGCLEGIDPLMIAAVQANEIERSR